MKAARILVDTDVLLDVALQRNPFAAHSADVLRWVEAGGKGCIAWHSVANCAYLLKDEGRGFLRDLLRIVEVAEVGSAAAEFALGLPMKDLEDALQVAAARAWRADTIITRNLADYKNSPIPAMKPTDFTKTLPED